MKFDCSKCPGYCCSHARIAVSSADIRRLARHFGISVAKATRRFTYRYRAENIDERILRHHKDTVYASVCRLFDRKTRKCTVYESRPLVCRRYPYGSQCGYYNFLKFERDFQDDQDYVPSA